MKRKEVHTFYNYQFKHTAVRVTNHPDIQTVDVAEALDIHPIMLYRWRGEMRTGKLKDNDQEARSKSGLIAAEKKIKQLEKELSKVRQENVVLRKAEKLFPGKK
jgi:transposase-like protein